MAIDAIGAALLGGAADAGASAAAVGAADVGVDVGAATAADVGAFGAADATDLAAASAIPDLTTGADIGVLDAGTAASAVWLANAASPRAPKPMPQRCRKSRRVRKKSSRRTAWLMGGASLDSLPFTPS